MKHEAIADAWAARNKLRDEGDKRYIEGYKLYIDCYELRDEADKLYIEGYRLFAEGRKLYRDAVTAKHGDEAVIDWETGEITPQPVACVQDPETDPHEKDAARCGAEAFTDERRRARQAAIDAWADKRNGGEG